MRQMLLVLALVFLGTARPASAQAPADATKPLSRIVFGSCADQDKPCPIWASIGKQKPDLMILLGDTIYADLNKSKKVTADLIKAKYDILDALPEFAAIKKTTPIMATWDDHDYGKNDAGKDWPLKDEAQTVFLDFFGVPVDSPRRQRKGVYHAEVFGPEGKRVQVIMLDGRYHKTEILRGKFDPRTRITPSLPTTDPDATFLGEEQWKWLEEQLKVPAEVRLIGSGIQVLSEEHPFEKWMLIPKERERLFKLLRATRASGVIVLSGDRHLAELSMSNDAISYPLYDLTSSGFNQANTAWRPAEKNKHRIAAMPFGHNFGMVNIDWTSETSPRLSLELRDEEGEIVARQVIRLGLLSANDNQANAGARKPAPAAGPELPRPEGVIAPADALKKVGDEITVQFEVKAGTLTKGGANARLLLNSESDFRSEMNFTVVVNAKARTDKYKAATVDTFKGKTIRAKGKVTEYQNRPQLEINDETMLEIVE